jgi:hypothetical protein
MYNIFSHDFKIVNSSDIRNYFTIFMFLTLNLDHTLVHLHVRVVHIRVVHQRYSTSFTLQNSTATLFTGLYFMVRSTVSFQHSLTTICMVCRQSARSSHMGLIYKINVVLENIHIHYHQLGRWFIILIQYVVGVIQARYPGEIKFKVQGQCTRFVFFVNFTDRLHPTHIHRTDLDLMSVNLIQQNSKTKKQAT